MPQWAGSCWYYLRFLDPTNAKAPIDPAIEKAWMPVDLYIGGAEHAVLHLLYARFWHKVLYDRGVVSTVEPFQKLVNQGMILGEMEFWGVRDESNNEWVTASKVPFSLDLLVSGSAPLVLYDGRRYTIESVLAKDVDKRGDGYVLKNHPEIGVVGKAQKMSKSRGNVINPDEVVKEYGADALRLYEMFMGPLEATKPWSMEGVNGVYNFLGRAWRMIVDDRAEEMALSPALTDDAPNADELRTLHKTIKAVTEDVAKLSFNTAIARMMEFTNFFTKQERRPRACMEPFVLLLSPFAPHMAEELWATLGHGKTLAYEPWPKFDDALIVESTVELAVQVNGKVRGKINVAADADNGTILAAAKAEPKVAEQIVGKTVVQEKVVPGRLVIIVVK
jgi:leucyl-tRNA synthetase